MTKPKRAKRPPSVTPKIGRPTVYRTEFVEQGERLCKLGATDADMAGFFGISLATLYTWKVKHPAFLEATKRGKDLSDDMVEQSLFRRALGYSHDAVKILQHEGQPLEVPYVQHYPPDTAAAFIWLKNRRPQQWRDRPMGDGGGDDDMARARRIKAALAEIEGVSDAPST